MKNKSTLSSILFLTILLFFLPGCGSTAPAQQPTETPTATVNPTNTLPPTATQPTSSPLPSSNTTPPLAPGKILTPTYVPAGYTPSDGATAIPETQQTVLTYLSTQPLDGSGGSLTATKTITLVQSFHNDQPPLQISPSAVLQEIQVNGHPALYTIGAWDASFVPDPNQTGGGRFEYTWRSDLQLQNVYWQVGDVYLVLVSDDRTIPLEELVKMAGSIQ